MNNIPTSYSFDDILICPQFSNVASRKDISLKTKLTDKIILNIPIISSPMDTVTEDDMAIAMALNGGLGIIHRFQSIETQVKMVKKVKRHLSYVIDDPYTINQECFVYELIDLMKEKGVSGILVINDFNKFEGIVSKKDVDVNILVNGEIMCNKLKVKDIMTPKNDVNYITKYDYVKILQIYKSLKIEKIPIIDSEMNIKGLVVFKNLMYFNNNKNIASLDTNGQLIVGAAIGINDYMERGEALVKAGVDLLCIDVANGYTQMMFDAIKELKKTFPQISIMAGNVCTADGFKFLCKAGADCIRVGIGNGCFTEDTKVLMANGTYKNINKIEIGEYVINKYGKPVKVLNIINRGKKQVMKINTNNWHKDIFVTPDHKYWISDLSITSKTTKLLDIQTNTVPNYKWKQISEIDNQKMFTLMPNKIEWLLSKNFTIDLNEYNKTGTITSNYKLGYIFGTYLGDGNTKIDEDNYSGSCMWLFDLNKHDIANKVKDYIQELLDYECIVSVKSDNVLSVNCYNKCFTYLLNEFGKNINKQLPNKYYCTNIEYIKGLYDGLIDSDGHNKTGSNEYLIELFNWCCMNLNISFCSMKSPEYSKDYVYNKVLSKELYDIQETWDIEVDCDTHSFIANNSIVHNSICSTRLQTGIGVCQFSALLECSKIAKKFNVSMISDGGHTGKVGNKFKALAAGARCVLLGRSLAGTTESPGKIIYKGGKRFKYYRGMASAYANLSKQEKLGNGNINTNFHIEGVEGEIEYKGSVSDQIKQICNGVRSGMSYLGVSTIAELHAIKVVFNKITPSGFSETLTRI